MEASALCVAQASVHFHSCNKILQAKIAAVGGRLEREWTACPNGIRELPGLARQQVLGDDRIHCDIPAFEVAGGQKLALPFLFVPLPPAAFYTAQSLLPLVAPH